MRKIATLSLSLCLLMLLSGYAAADEMNFAFLLSVDGAQQIEADKGDLLSLQLHLCRQDAAGEYTMHGMQAELQYDGEMLEIQSISTAPGVQSREIAAAGEYREVYLNFLSINGETTWERDSWIGTVQFRVIGDKGVAKISNGDFLVALPDGFGSYPCESNDALVILSSACRVRFQTNGGTELGEQSVPFGEKLPKPKDPVREGYHISGWYRDIYLTDAWNFEEDVVESNLRLYAKWEEGAPVPRQNPWILSAALLALAAGAYLWKKRKNG